MYFPTVNYKNIYTELYIHYRYIYTVYTVYSIRIGYNTQFSILHVYLQNIIYIYVVKYKYKLHSICIYFIHKTCNSLSCGNPSLHNNYSLWKSRVPLIGLMSNLLSLIKIVFFFLNVAVKNPFLS